MKSLQPPTSADNVALHAFPCCSVVAAECRPPQVQTSIDICRPPGLQQQIRSTDTRRSDGTDRRTDGRATHAQICVYCTGSVDKHGESAKVYQCWTSLQLDQNLRGLRVLSGPPSRAGKRTVVMGHFVCIQNKRQEAISSHNVPNNWQSGELIQSRLNVNIIQCNTNRNAQE